MDILNTVTGLIIVQRFAVYVFDIHKLHLTFECSIFEIKYYKIIIGYIIVIALCVGYFVGIFYVNPTITLYLNGNGCQNIKYISYVGLIFSILDTLLEYILTRLLTKRLEGVLKIKKVSKIENVVKKLQFLCIISILSTIIFISFPILFPYTKPQRIFSIDLVFRNGILILSFGRATHIYQRLCKCKFKSCTISYKMNRMRAVQSGSIQATDVQLKTENEHKKSKSSVTLDIKSITKNIDHNKNKTQSSVTVADVLMDITDNQSRMHSIQTSISQFIHKFNQKSITIKAGVSITKPAKSQTFNIKSGELDITQLGLENIESNNNNKLNRETITPNLCSKKLKELGIII